MYTILGVLQIIIAVVLVFLILLHSGKDAGLSGAFGIGGGGSQIGGGSMVERNLDRATVFFAMLFVVNTIVLLKIAQSGPLSPGGNAPSAWAGRAPRAGREGRRDTRRGHRGGPAAWLPPDYGRGQSTSARAGVVRGARCGRRRVTEVLKKWRVREPSLDCRASGLEPPRRPLRSIARRRTWLRATNRIDDVGQERRPRPPFGPRPPSRREAPSLRPLNARSRPVNSRIPVTVA